MIDFILTVIASIGLSTQPAPPAKPTVAVVAVMRIE